MNKRFLVLALIFSGMAMTSFHFPQPTAASMATEASSAPSASALDLMIQIESP